MNLASRIKAARIAAGVKKGELAKSAGVTPGAVTQWETGQVKSLKGGTLISLAAALKVSPSWLKDGKGEMATPAILSQIESELVSVFRSLHLSNQTTLMTTARAMLANQPNMEPSAVSPFPSAKV